MTNWTTTEIVSGQASGATLVLVGDTGIFAPKHLHERTSALVARAGFEAKLGRWLDAVSEQPDAERLLILGVGSASLPDRWRTAGGHLVDAMAALHIDTVIIPASKDIGNDVDLSRLLESVLLYSYCFDDGRKERKPGVVTRRIHIDAADQSAADTSLLAANPVNRARAWIETPSNILTPGVFADEAEAVLVPLGLTVQKLGEDVLAELGAGGILAVGQGSDFESLLFVAEYRGNPSNAGWDAVLIGKGLTFDSGGLNLKGRPVISKMKVDMAGGAAVIAAAELAAERKAPLNIAVVVPMVENSISGNAFRPGDVITSLAGLTIEVKDTDAEGRIVLADAISYAIDCYDPTHIVDLATLTGGMASIFHEDFAGLFSTDDALAEALTEAGTQVHEHLWRLPLVARQDYLVESSEADVANLGASGFFGANGGGTTAGAKFLERFAKGRSWAHLDIASTAWTSRRSARGPSGATAFGASLLDEWLKRLEGNIDARP